jgi:hypothetical protein
VLAQTPTTFGIIPKSKCSRQARAAWISVTGAIIIHAQALAFIGGSGSRYPQGDELPRRTFFSFHYKPDVWRAWNVRNCWVVQPGEEESVGFFDSSVFEASQKESDDALKGFLRNGLKNTSVTCVLAGTRTWSRRWVNTRSLGAF